MTDQNYEELRARLDALELAVTTVARLDRKLMLELQQVFTREFQLAYQQAAQVDKIDMGQIRREPKPARNVDREQAKVNELRRLGRTFGAGL
ncbi:hypothetical protein KTE28_03620 [Burkholderia multivorans]|uniref:hypothetical protein n=1 Tax=Burkholderia multivorans TaxID=87883 RepID=UPI001C251E87|nr:hypothetical protein [Burkholderia multivorans]MBU9373421.1 hypothetical protein [Burkholderia multivorans]